MGDGKLPLRKETDFSGIKKIFLLLGPACNMRCRHCSQVPIKNGERIRHDVDVSVWELFDGYISYCLTHKLTGPRKIFPSIIFWGGEPLLHWDFIKETVVRYTEKFNITDESSFAFSFVTNGLLMDDEKVDFLNRYPVKVSLSYDAPYPFAVRGKIDESVCDTVKKLKKYSTISTFNALNCDYYLALRCMRKKFPHVRNSFNLPLLHTFDMPEDIFSYDFDKIRKSLKKICIAIKLGDINASAMVHHIAWPLQYPVGASFFREHRFKSCSSGESNFSVMLDGSVVTCHNSMEKIGTLDDDRWTIRDRMIGAYSKRRSPECDVCEHADICVGNCSFSLRDGEGKYLSCGEFFKPFYTALKEELRHLPDPLTEEEKKWFEDECRKDDEIVDAF